MSNTRSVDDLLVKVQNEQANSQAPVQSAVEVGSIPDQPVTQAQEEIKQQPIPELAAAETDNKVATTVGENTSSTDTPVSESPAGESTASPIDEYGNPVEKPKMYSEDEVQRMIRDRLSRGRQVEQPTPQQIQSVAKDFTADPNSEEPWEQQLEAFVEKTIEKRQNKLSEQQWKQQEAAKQAEFEAKFTSGMSKYQDFHQVVAGKPITDGIMLASRALDNPAAFIYGASKLHPHELDRISRIADPYSQAAEVGRLHERMVKAKNATSKAPAPIAAPKGDMAIPHNERPSIDSLIRTHERQKFGSKR